MSDGTYKEDFSSRTGRWVVRLPGLVLQAMRDLSESSWPTETGGILTGFYTATGEAAFVTRALPPPPDSRGSRTTFYRGTQGLDEILQQLWDRFRREHYLGEWHLHSAGDGSPSRRDRRQMQEIARLSDYQCSKPILVIVRRGTGKEWAPRVFVFSSCGRFHELL